MIYMWRQKSLDMKLFSSSPPKDLQKISNSSLLLKLEIMQKQLRDLRDDNSDIKRRLTRVISIMTNTTPVEREEEYPEEELAHKDSPGSD